MKLKSLVAAASLGAALLMAGSAANAITYTGTQDIDGETVNLSITTDGTIGSVYTSDIVADSISVSGPAGAFNSSDSDVILNQINFIGFNEPHLTATPTDLTYTIRSGGDGDVDGADGFNILIEYPEVDMMGNFGYFCVGNYCGLSGTVVGESVGLYSYNAGDPMDFEAIGTDPVGTVITLGTAVSPAPEPSTWALMIAGIGLAGGAMRVRARRSFAAVAGA